jgi:hypothetical protein
MIYYVALRRPFRGEARRRFSRGPPQTAHPLEKYFRMSTSRIHRIF